MRWRDFTPLCGSTLSDADILKSTAGCIVERCDAINIVHVERHSGVFFPNTGIVGIEIKRSLTFDGMLFYQNGGSTH